jgi:hypothetical protein
MGDFLSKKIDYVLHEKFRNALFRVPLEKILSKITLSHVLLKLDYFKIYFIKICDTLKGVVIYQMSFSF